MLSEEPPSSPSSSSSPSLSESLAPRDRFAIRSNSVLPPADAAAGAAPLPPELPLLPLAPEETASDVSPPNP